MNTKQPRMPTPPPNPRAAPINGPEAYAPSTGHNSFLTQAMHEDVGRVMQNIIDLQTEVSQLRKQNMEWERRALLAEGKVTALIQEIEDQKEDFNKEIDLQSNRHRLAIQIITKELDYFKNRDAVVQTKLTIGAKHFLDCIQAIDDDAKHHETEALTAVEDEINKLLEETDKEPHGDDRQSAKVATTQSPRQES